MIRIVITRAIITFIIYIFAFQPQKSTTAQILDSIPFFQEKKKEIFRDLTVEALKIIGIYLTLTTFKIKGI